MMVCVESGTKTMRLPVIYERGGGDRANGCLTLCQHIPESETETVNVCGQKVAARAYRVMKLSSLRGADTDGCVRLNNDTTKIRQLAVRRSLRFFLNSIRFTLQAS